LPEITLENDKEIYLYLGDSCDNSNVSVVGNVYFGDIVMVKQGKFTIINRTLKDFNGTNSSSS
jgi:hypothetical protein